MRIAYFDCFSGAAGDMILGALIDAGMPVETLRERLAALAVDGYELTARRVVRLGLACTQVDVRLAGEQRAHRHLSQIVGIIRDSALTPAVRRRAAAVFTRLAEAEAAVHGTDVQNVHFHEVGAVDAIVDIVGAAVALDHWQVQEVFCSPLGVGSGTVRCAHGELPVPAPATAELIRGVPVRPTGEDGERLTPTGAAILTALAAGYGPMPAMTVRHVGCGCGTREGTNRPNVLRVLIGETADAEPADDVVWLLETNVDDMTGEQAAYAMERLMAAGARDVWAAPVTMKKGRPALVLSVLADDGALAAVEEALFAETTTFGIRRRRVARLTLAREHVEVATAYGPLRVKVGRRDGRIVQASAEFEDCRRAAEAAGVPLQTVIDAAMAAWRPDRPEREG
jgi:uncharacterized protein (TIGR00299 family) protein